MYCSKCGAMIADGAAFCSACGQPTHGAPQMAAGSPASVGAAAPQASAVAYRGPYAGFWLRLVAHLIDGVVIGIPFLVIFFSLAASAGFWAAVNNIHEGENPGPAFGLFLVSLILPFIAIAVVGQWLYYALMESSSWQATLGKKALDLRVTDLAGHRVSLGRASGRFFAKIISGLIPLGIGYIVAGFTEKKQAVHDMIAGCLVIRKA